MCGCVCEREREFVGVCECEWVHAGGCVQGREKVVIPNWSVFPSIVRSFSCVEEIQTKKRHSHFAALI